MTSRAVRALGPVFALLAFAPAGGWETPVRAASRSKSLSVSISVVANCTISTTPLAFGSFDPVVVNATAPLDAGGLVTIACTKGAATAVDLDLGQHALATARRMWSGAEYLEYELYQDAGRTQIWGTGTQAMTPPVAPSKVPRPFTVYGRVPGGQDVAAGSYSDTVMATVNF
jgi:spore coat protein U-like protein